MAGEWIKFECSLPEKPETLAITAAMGWTDPDLTVGKLMRLFRWFDQQTVDGNAARVTPALLDHVLGVTGLTQAVVSVGWLIVTDAGISLAKFDRHNGESAKQRGLTAKRVAKHKGNAKGNDEGNATGVSSALPKEEKRREDIDTPRTPVGGAGRFEDFWSAWPANERKQDKAKCAKKWKASALDASADRILADIEVKRQTQKWQDGFVEAPLVYLSGSRWEDGVMPGSAQSSASKFAGCI